MFLRKIFFKANQRFIEKIIFQICQDRIGEKLTQTQMKLISKKLRFKVLHLNMIFYYGIMCLTIILGIININRKRIIFFENLDFFFTLKNFYLKIIVFLFYAELRNGK